MASTFCISTSLPIAVSMLGYSVLICRIILPEPSLGIVRYLLRGIAHLFLGHKNLYTELYHLQYRCKPKTELLTNHCFLALQELSYIPFFPEQTEYQSLDILQVCY